MAICNSLFNSLSGYIEYIIFIYAPSPWRNRLLTERLVVQVHLGTSIICQDHSQATVLTDNHLKSKQRLPMLVLDCFLFFLSDYDCLYWMKEKRYHGFLQIDHMADETDCYAISHSCCSLQDCIYNVSSLTLREKK